MKSGGVLGPAEDQLVQLPLAHSSEPPLLLQLHQASFRLQFGPSLRNCHILLVVGVTRTGLIAREWGKVDWRKESVGEGGVLAKLSLQTAEIEF
jgi:hypothetical protein